MSQKIKERSVPKYTVLHADKLGSQSITQNSVFWHRQNWINHLDRTTE